MNQQTMMEHVRRQLAIDYNCLPEDFLKDEIIFTDAVMLDGRRPFPWRSPRVEMAAMGNAVVINASDDVMKSVRERLSGKSRDEVLSSLFFRGLSPYFLPDVENIRPQAFPAGFEFEMMEKSGIAELYSLKGFPNALHYHPAPLELAYVAKISGKVIGIAGVSADCAMLWQIGVDVLPSFGGKGVATALVDALTLEVINRGYIPYYGTAADNVKSQRVAEKAGYTQVWTHCYKTVLDKSSFTNKLKKLFNKS